MWFTHQTKGSIYNYGYGITYTFPEDGYYFATANCQEVGVDQYGHSFSSSCDPYAPYNPLNMPVVVTAEITVGPMPDIPPAWNTTTFAVYEQKDPSPPPADDLGTDTNPDDPCSGQGSPVWSVNKINMNLNISDTPIWYKPAYGPQVKLQLSYNSLASIDATAPFGNKWTFNYGSSLAVDGSGNVTVNMPDGRQDAYTLSGGIYTKPFGVFNTLTHTSGSQYQLRFLDDTVYVYDIPQSSGLTKPSLVQIIDPHGLPLTLSYVGGKLSTITDAGGQTTSFQYAQDSLTVTDPSLSPRHATFLFDTSGNLVSASDMGTYITTYTYNADSYLTGITKSNGTSSSTWVFKIEPNDGSSTAVAYPAPDDPLGMGKNYRITITDPNNHAEEYFYNGANTWYVSPRDYVTYFKDPVTGAISNNLTSAAPKTSYFFDRSSLPKVKLANIVTPEQNFTRYTYDPVTGRPASITDANNHTTHYQYNSNGRITYFWDATITTPTTSNATISYAYYSNGVDVHTITDGLGTVTYQYGTYNSYSTHDVTDILDRMSVSVETKYEYDSYGRLTSAIEANNVSALKTTTSFVYDAPNNTLHKILKHQGSQSDTLMGTFDFDNIGRLSDATYADGVYVTYQYMGLDQLSQINYPDNRTEVISNNTSCPFMVNSTTDRSGLTTTYSYDALRRLYYKTVGPSGALLQTFQYGYDANSNLTSFTDANSRVTTFGYDHDNRLNLKTYADGNSISYTYWPNGLLRLTTSARPQTTTTYLYDPINNLTNINYTTGTGVTATPNVTLHYDPNNRLDYRIDGIGTFYYGYDNNRRLLTVTYPGDTQPTITYTYNSLGQLSTMQALGSQLITYGYDGIGRLSTIQRGSDAPYVYSYDTTISPSSPIVQKLTRPNGGNTQYQHQYNDPLNKLMGLYNYYHPNTGSDSIISSYAYAYADATHPDMISTETVTNGAVIDNFINGTTTYSYINADSTQNKVNQVQKVNGAALIYDNDGNMTRAYTPSGYPMTLGYDAANRLTSASFTDNQNVTHQTSYSYSGDGVLTEMIKTLETNGNGIWTTASDIRYVRDRLLSVQEKDGLNSWIVKREYLWGKNRAGGIGGLLNLRQNSQDYNYLYDGKGNVVTVIDSTQTPVDTYAYDSFGVLMKKSATVDQPYMFSTKEYDADTGLSYYGFRFYDAALGRWINRDPLREYGDVNLYRFVGNSPVNWVDPFGLQAMVLPGPIPLPLILPPTPQQQAANQQLANDIWQGFQNAGDAISDMINMAKDWWNSYAKTPNTGDPGSRCKNPGSGQERQYGADGQPETDIDYDHHDDPHAHNWDRDANGNPVRGQGYPVSPWPQGR